MLIGLASKIVGLDQQATSVVAGAALGLLVGFGTPYAFDMSGHATASLSTASGMTMPPSVVDDEALGSTVNLIARSEYVSSWDLGNWQIVTEKDRYYLHRRAIEWSSLEEQERAPLPPEIIPDEDATVLRPSTSTHSSWTALGSFVVPEQALTPQPA